MLWPPPPAVRREPKGVGIGDEVEIAFSVQAGECRGVGIALLDTDPAA
jgi:hypothetical protein